MKDIQSYIYEDSNRDLSPELKKFADKLIKFYQEEIAKNVTEDELMMIDDYVGSPKQYDEICKYCKK